MSDRDIRAKEASRAGAAAFRAGVPRSANPEPLGTLQRWAWDVGWRGAESGAAWAMTNMPLPHAAE